MSVENKFCEMTKTCDNCQKILTKTCDNCQKISTNLSEIIGIKAPDLETFFICYKCLLAHEKMFTEIMVGHERLDEVLKWARKFDE